MDAFATTGVHCTPVNTGIASPLNDGLTDYSPRDKPWDTHKGQGHPDQQVQRCASVWLGG
jgi:hypothetical protein